MLRKPDLYNEAVALRSKGLSYNEILKFVHVGQGTISRWCSKILLTKEQKERLLEKKRNTPLIRQLRRQAIQCKKEAKVWAKEQISKLSDRDTAQILFLSGILLYWAEGTKQSGCKGIEFTNTDPDMILMMMEFFREILKIPENKFRITVRMGHKGNIRRAENYWSNLTQVSREQFNNPELLNLKKNSKSLEKYPYGMCRIIIHNVSASRKMAVLIKELAKKFCPRSSMDRTRVS